MVGLFIVNEYHRSWQTYYINIYDNIFDFAIERLALYYSTALYNGAGILSILGWGNGHPMYTFDWPMHFPVIGQRFKPLLDSSADFDSFLNRHVDPKFNNPSGIFDHFYEWGRFALFIAVFIDRSSTRVIRAGAQATGSSASPIPRCTSVCGRSSVPQTCSAAEI